MGVSKKTIELDIAALSLEYPIYLKGLSQFFISDVMDEDIACYIGVDDRKLLLFDDFKCFDEGTYVGTVSKGTIENMRKAN